MISVKATDMIHTTNMYYVCVLCTIMYFVYAYVCQELGTFSLYYVVFSSGLHNHYNTHYCASVVEITMWSTIEWYAREWGVLNACFNVVYTYVYPNVLLMMSGLTGVMYPSARNNCGYKTLRFVHF